MKSGSVSEVLPRIMKYCAGAERCTQDVEIKLDAWEVNPADQREILEILRREKFLDDKRYAISYVAEKWNLDHWGREKIRHGLRSKGYEEPGIEAAMTILNPDDYVSTLHQVLAKKRKELTVQDRKTVGQRVLSFGISRGFEEELIMEWLESNGFLFDD